MGEQADLMVNGVTCQACGEYLDEETGFPTTCDRCLGIDRTSRADRRQQAAIDFTEAQRRAEFKGLKLTKFTEQHYQLTNGKWIQNIYPGNRRLYWDRNHAKPPFLKLPPDWTIFDVIGAS